MTNGQEDYQNIQNMQPNAGSTESISPTPSAPSAPSAPKTTTTPSGETLKLGPDTSTLTGMTNSMTEKINEYRSMTVPSIAQIGVFLWKNLVKPKLLTERQICKKIIMMNGQYYTPPITEDRVQLIVYGKIYDKKPGLPTDTILTLWDNDKSDTNCVSKPTDKHYIPPLDKNAPMMKEVLNKKEQLRKSMQELGIFAGQLAITQPTAMVQIVATTTSIASSLVIMPPGSGLPVAFASLLTMMNVIRKIQESIGAILPFLEPLQFLSLLLPASAQPIVGQVNAIITILMVYIGLIGKLIEGFLGLISKLTSKFPGLGTDKVTVPTVPLTVSPTADSIN